MEPKKRPRPKPVQRLQKEKQKAVAAEQLEPNKNGLKWLPNARDLEIYELYCEGDKSQRELAKQYKRALSTINEIIHKVEAHFAAESVMQIRDLRARATKRFEAIFSKAIQSYKRSLEDEVTRTTETGGENGPKTTERRVGQAGSAALLAQAREAMSELLDVWGAKAPKAIAVEVTETLRIGGLTPEQAVKSRIEHLQSMLGNGNGKE